MSAKSGSAIDLESSINRLRDTDKGEKIDQIPVDKIKTNPFQPRKVFDEDALQQLAQNIKTDGLNEPIIVRLFSSESSDCLFEIVAGERRWRAHKILGLPTIAAIIKDYDDLRSKRVGLVENIQRENLNTIEIAYGIKSMKDDYVKEREVKGLPADEKSLREQIAAEVGKTVKTIENYLRIYNAATAIPEVESLLLANTDRISVSPSLEFASVVDKFRVLKKSNNREYERIMRRKGKEFADRKNRDAFGKVVDYLFRYFHKDKSCDRKNSGANSTVVPFFQESDAKLILNIGIAKDSVESTDIQQINEAVSDFMDRLTALMQPVNEQ